MFFDRDIATQNLNNQISDNNGWIVISGKKSIGKTSFVKNAISNKLYIYCEPIYELDYMREFSKTISLYSREILEIFSKTTIYIKENYNQIIKKKTDFFKDLSDNDITDCVEEIIYKELNDKKSYFARSIGTFLKDKVNYIVIDNLYNCDLLFYKWFVSLDQSFTSNNNRVIAICDTDATWQSDTIKSLFENILYNITYPINIEKFDNINAYFELLNNNIYFNNDLYTKRVAKKLYKKFDGDSSKIFQLINLCRNKVHTIYDDDVKEAMILQQSNTLSETIFNYITFFQKNILATLALSPISLNIEQICEITEHNLSENKEQIFKLIEKNLIMLDLDINKNETYYKESNTFSKEEYINLVNSNTVFYIQKKLYALHKKGIISLSIVDYTKIALYINSSDLYDIVKMYITELDSPKDDEKISDIINKTINITDEIYDYFKNFKTVNLLYKFGWYKNALRIINKIDNQEISYELLMKKGDIQHLLLYPETSATFKKASEINTITISQKLSAINRQIMAMTQQDQNGLIEARILYNYILKEYRDEKCNGLIELYRNSNNILNFQEAIKYTIEGYYMACELDNKIEKIKCMHNICMLNLYNNNSCQKIEKGELRLTPTFNTVFDEINQLEGYRHETAYPLLDMGTVEMFKFNVDNNHNHLQTARNFYSKAQLYAKSFYATNIAKMGLLVVNSYLYKNSTSLKEIRSKMYQDYKNEKSNIKDFRVHRKILFSLATSCLITGDTNQGIEYLLESKPHVFEGEILRFNNLCDAFNISQEKISTQNIDFNNITEYHKTIKFVPWLISFGH